MTPLVLSIGIGTFCLLAEGYQAVFPEAAELAIM